MSLRSRLLKLAYQIHRHELGGRPLARWGGIALVLVGALGALGVLPGGWAVTATAGLLLSGLVAFSLWARRRGYVEFLAQEASSGRMNPEGSALTPQDKIAIRATGHFEVEGRRGFFVELQAFFRTFATREHAVIAYVPRSRFLKVARWPEHEVGLWYIFFLPSQVVDLAPGTLVFGRERRLALRVLYQGERGMETVYLSFDSEIDRRRVWEDLLWDATPRA